MTQPDMLRTCLVLLPWIIGPGVLGGCKKEPPQSPPSPVAQAPSPAPTPTPAPAPRPAPTATPRASVAEAPQAPHGAATPRTAAPDGEKQEEGTVLRVRKLRGGRTTFSSSGVSHSRGETSYEVQVGLADGTRFAFLPLKNLLTVGSKVEVRYLVKDGKQTRLSLPVAVPSESSTISGQVLPPLKPTPVGDGTFSITFPNVPDERKTDLGILYTYDYRFHQSYQPDTFHFFRATTEGDGGAKFFKEQAASLLALVGGKRVDVRIGAGKRDRKTGLKRASGRFVFEQGYTPRDGVMQLWLDARKKVLYAAWVEAYSPNQLAAEAEMHQRFFGSFTLKP